MTDGRQDPIDDGLTRFGERIAPRLRALDPDPAHASQVAERILARLPLGSRRRFASPALRLVAASLVAHLLALPVLAWFAFQAPKEAPPFVIRFEPYHDEYAFEAPPPPASVDPGPWGREQARRVERFRIAEVPAEELDRARAAAAAAPASQAWHAAYAARLELLAAPDRAAARAAAERALAASAAAARAGDSAADIAATLALGARFDLALVLDDGELLEALVPELDTLPLAGAPALGARLRARAAALHLVDGPEPSQASAPLSDLVADVEADRILARDDG